VRAPQTLGADCLLGNKSQATGAVVLSDAKVIVIRVDQAASFYADASQLMKLLLKTTLEREKTLLQEIKSQKGGSDSSPCPPEAISKLFAAIYHTARYKGTASENQVAIGWEPFRQYAQRVFAETPLRIENACNILVRLGIASYTKVPDETDPEGPPRIGTITFTDLAFVEGFFEYYTHHYFKSSGAAILKVDDRCTKFVKALLACAQDARMDRGGVVQANLIETLEKLNTAMGTQNTDYLTLVEAKGLFAKKSPSNSGGLFQFHRAEWESALRCWAVLKEIERWNETGSVDPEAPVEAQAAASASGLCSGCAKPVEPAANFCGHCGRKQKLAAA
jgi:hypothetical protein